MFSFIPLMAHWKNHLHTPSRKVRDTWRLRDGTAVTLRAARVDDGSLMQDLVRGLSATSRYHRFFFPLHEMPPEMLDRFTHNARSEAMTILAVIQSDGLERPVAMAQYVADRYPERAEFAVVVADAWQGYGLGKRLVKTLICMARAAGLKRIEGDVLTENETMMQLMRKLGFQVMPHEDGTYLRKVSKVLDVPEWKCSPLAAVLVK